MTAERLLRITAGLALLGLSACPDDPSGSPETEGASSTMDPEGSSTGGSTGGSTSSADGTGDSTEGGGVEDTTGENPLPPLPCPDDWQCKEDQDGDDKPLVCDNDPDHTNAEQGDMDFDSVGDSADLCPTVQTVGESYDSDDDGVGNDCDLCRYRASDYLGEVMLPARYTIRNIPLQGDADRDGLGDACDNCPTVPNCLGYGLGAGLTPYEPGMPLVIEDIEGPDCQVDSNFDGVGDACQGNMQPGAAGPVGFGPTDDFDQDGLTNATDYCPRLPADLGSCAGPADCPEGSSCTDGVCNHRDPDGDQVGNECDTCPFASNPAQVMEGMQASDDPDGDFIGNACETDPGCETRSDPRPIRFYDVAVGGYCCTTFYQGQALEDPDGNALDPGSLPVTEPGMLELPPGCAQALAQAGVTEATPLSPVDVGGLAELWPHLCLVAPWDQDFDGIGDKCDLCEFAYDPTNSPFVDSNGMEWPNDGAYCNGEYACTD